MRYKIGVLYDGGEMVNHEATSDDRTLFIVDGHHTEIGKELLAQRCYFMEFGFELTTSTTPVSMTSPLMHA